MNSIAQLASLPRRATSAELRRHLGQPLIPCQAPIPPDNAPCNCPLYNVTHQAELRCAACSSGRLNNARGDSPDVRQHVALRVLVVLLADGRQVAEEIQTRLPTKDRTSKC